MRGQMGITGQQKNQLRGDASVMKSEKKDEPFKRGEAF